MVEDKYGSSPPKRIENHAELLRRSDEPKVEAIGRRLDVALQLIGVFVTCRAS